MYVECVWCGKTFYRRKSDKRYTGIYCSQDCITARDQSNYKVKFLRENKVFRIVTYTDKNNVLIKCRTCGEEITTNSTAALRRKICLNCDRIKREKTKEQAQERKAQEQAIKEKIKEIENLQKKADKMGARIEREWKAINARERRKENEKAERKLHELKREKRIKTNGKTDKNITLKRLYERDNGICYLCGKPCNYEDYTRSDKGAFIAGKLYPSIDHVKPLSHGGTHTWDNVRLAHMICNSLKRDRIPPTPLIF